MGELIWRLADNEAKEDEKHSSHKLADIKNKGKPDLVGSIERVERKLQNIAIPQNNTTHYGQDANKVIDELVWRLTNQEIHERTLSKVNQVGDLEALTKLVEEEKPQKKTTSPVDTTNQEQGNEEVQEIACYTVTKTSNHIQINYCLA